MLLTQSDTATMMPNLACKITTTVAALLIFGVTRGVNAKNLKLPKPEMKTYEALTQAMPLYTGEVSNSWHNVAIPPGPIAIYEFSADVVELDPVSGEIIPVPLSDAYLHHHVVFSKEKYYQGKKHWWPMKPEKSKGRGVGFGAGTESRGTVQHFPYPYGVTTVQHEDELTANVHVINTRSMEVEKAHHCLECPCTQEDKDLKFHKVSKLDLMLKAKEDEYLKKHGMSSKDLQSISTNGTTSSGLLSAVAERRLDWDRCNSELVDEQNSACSPDLYYGGLICCEDGEFCLDEYYLSENELIALNNLQEEPHGSNPRLKQSTYYLRYSLSYSDIVPETKPVYLASCCDATGNLTAKGNIEYDIPQLCDPTDPNVDPSSEDCIHEITTVQYLSKDENSIYGTTNGHEEVTDVEVVYLVGHLHRGGMEISAYNFETNELICQSLPMYGDGEVNEIGNEPGYINSMSDCSFDPPLRMKTNDKIRLVARYNATQSHTGVMALFYFAVHDVEEGAAETKGFLQHYNKFAILAAVTVLVAAAVHVVNKHQYDVFKRQGYDKVPTNMNI